MSAAHPSTPVLVGAGQVHEADRTATVSMPDMMTTAARRALADTGGAEHLRQQIQLAGAADCLTWRPNDAAGAIAAAVGAAPRETVATRPSGTSPLDLLTDACERIHSGEIDAALLVGGEAVRALHNGTLDNGSFESGETEPTRILGPDRHPSHPAEEAAELRTPVHYYPLLENALRAAYGRDISDHERWIAELWAGFADVARTNPHAWNQDGPDAEAINDPANGNRILALPYRKHMIANIQVNQAAALVVCSAATAEAAGVARERWIYVHSTAAANDHWFVGNRAQLHRSPALGAIGRAILDHAGLSMDDIAHRDLYSCFPSAVQIAAEELGIDLDEASRPPTVTGGLTFAGGPGSNYVMHSLASLTESLRRDPHGKGIATAMGWYCTKHAAALLSAGEPKDGYSHHNVQSEVDGTPARDIGEGFAGEATVESYTVSYERSGEPETGHLVCLTHDGRRAFGMTTEPEAVARLVKDDPIGRPAHLPSCTLS